MSADTSGPAFPVPEVFDERRGEVTQYGSTGMTLRDYFAAKAMQAMAAKGGYEKWIYISQDAYELADAMLEARK